MTDLFAHPVFKEAIADIESLGVRVSSEASPHSKPYAVIEGRSNARWWLIPLEKGRLTASGLALFQPLLVSARYMKAAAGILSTIGLSRLWVKHKVYLSGESLLAGYFQPAELLSFAYFTGTDSPHRKVAVQVMDDRGNLKGFAKLTRNSEVQALLAREASTLQYIQDLGLESAYVPNNLFFGSVGDGTLLVTDTLKTHRTSSTSEFTSTHRAFILELSKKTAASFTVFANDFGESFRVRYSRIRPFLEQSWSARLDEAIGFLEAQMELQLTVSFSHGDFTPWNTFITNGRLYVFDWEYAEQVCLPSNDIIHFILNEPRIRRLSVTAKIDFIMSYLAQPWIGIQQKAIPTLIIIYLLLQSLRQIERQPNDKKRNQVWDGAVENATMIDKLMLKNTSLYA